MKKIGVDKPAVQEQLVAKTSNPLHLRLKSEEAGVYELQINSTAEAKKGLLVRLDRPAVRTLPAQGQGYFFVPRDTRAIGVKMSGHAVLLDASGKVVFDNQVDANDIIPVAVPSGSDDQLWYFQGDLIELVGAPPYVAARPEDMLVPEELIKTGPR